MKKFLSITIFFLSLLHSFAQSDNFSVVLKVRNYTENTLYFQFNEKKGKYSFIEKNGKNFKVGGVSQDEIDCTPLLKEGKTYTLSARNANDEEVASFEDIEIPRKWRGEKFVIEWDIPKSSYEPKIESISYTQKRGGSLKEISLKDMEKSGMQDSAVSPAQFSAENSEVSASEDSDERQEAATTQASAEEPDVPAENDEAISIDFVDISSPITIVFDAPLCVDISLGEIFLEYKENGKNANVAVTGEIKSDKTYFHIDAKDNPLVSGADYAIHLKPRATDGRKLAEIEIPVKTSSDYELSPAENPAVSTTKSGVVKIRWHSPEISQKDTLKVLKKGAAVGSAAEGDWETPSGWRNHSERFEAGRKVYEFVYFDEEEPFIFKIISEDGKGNSVETRPIPSISTEFAGKDLKIPVKKTVSCESAKISIEQEFARKMEKLGLVISISDGKQKVLERLSESNGFSYSFKCLDRTPGEREEFTVSLETPDGINITGDAKQLVVVKFKTNEKYRKEFLSHAKKQLLAAQKRVEDFAVPKFSDSSENFSIFNAAVEELEKAKKVEFLKMKNRGTYKKDESLAAESKRLDALFWEKYNKILKAAVLNLAESRNTEEERIMSTVSALRKYKNLDNWDEIADDPKIMDAVEEIDEEYHKDLYETSDYAILENQRPRTLWTIGASGYHSKVYSDGAGVSVIPAIGLSYGIFPNVFIGGAADIALPVFSVVGLVGTNLTLASHFNLHALAGYGGAYDFDSDVETSGNITRIGVGIDLFYYSKWDTAAITFEYSIDFVTGIGFADRYYIGYSMYLDGKIPGFFQKHNRWH